VIVRLGRDFGKLWTASAVSTLGDGITVTAGPLLAATLTRDPLLIGVVGAASFAPWLLVGLVSGALVDRLDRRRVLWTVDLARAAVLAALALAILAGWASIPLLAGGAFLLGVGQTLFDSAAQASIPSLVGRDADRLATANGRLLGAQTVSQQFAGPPVGGALFSVAPWVPYAADAVSFLGSSVLLARIRGRITVERTGPPRSIRADIAEGLRWLVRHRLLRGLAVLTGVLNLVFMAAETVLVLVAQDRLGLGNLGYGLLLTSTAAGSLLGSLVVGRLTRWWGEAATYLVTVGLLIAVLVVLGLTTLVPAAGVALALLGFAVTVGNVIVQSLRQAVTPGALLGRVVSVYRLVGLGAIPVGALVGGLLGRVDLRLPYLAGAGVLVLVWVQAALLLRGGAIARARAAAEDAERAYEDAAEMG
jgi:MFS family permease